MAILEVNDVSIRYMIGDFKDIGIKEYILRRLKNNYHVQEFWADRHVNFSIERGDMLGIIGTNGAGKSTLLKAVSGIMEPTEGSVKREGTIAALLELGSGFDGQLTVRENTYLRGAMLGYTRKFMDETYDSIIEFAELREFQDRPFKQLSSGMKARLAFSIASLVQPDILILDEVLAVGDGAFRQKSERKMREIIGGGTTTILVSHSVAQVREMCNKVLWLHKGEQVAFGDNVDELCDRYEAFLNGDASALTENTPSSKKETVPAAPKNAPAKISIFGSCVSRDCFRLFPNSAIELCSYVARQSVVSAVSAPLEAEESQVQLDSSFQRRMVCNDFRKTTFDTLRNDGSQWLLIDLIDERFALAKIGESLVTRSTEAVNSGMIPADATLLTPQPDGCGYSVDGVGLQKYLAEFARRVLEIYPSERIILHRALAAKSYKDADGNLHPYDTGKSGADEQLNNLLEYMYDELKKLIPEAKEIRCAHQFYGSSDHLWGLQSVHYEDKYYAEVMRYIKNIVFPTRKPLSRVEAFLRKEQVSSGPWPVRYVLEPHPGASWLAVIFSAFAGPNDPVQHPYHFISAMGDLPVHKLYLQDSYGSRGVYYLCSGGDFGVRDSVSALIREVQQELGCDDAHTVSLGSSKGGSAAAYFGLSHNFSHALAMVPQLRIGSYVSGLSATRKDMFGDTPQETAFADLDQQMVSLLEKNTATHLHILTSEKDEQYPQQIEPLLPLLKKHSVTKENKILSHADAAAFNQAFVHENLCEIIFGLHAVCTDEELVLWRDPDAASQKRMQYHYVTPSGKPAVLNISEQKQTLPLKKVCLGELQIALGGGKIYRRTLCSWFVESLEAQFVENPSSWTVSLQTPAGCTIPFEYACYVYDRAGNVHKSDYSSHPTICVPRGEKRAKKFLCFWKYKDFLLTKTVERVSPKTDVDINELQYSLRVEDGVLHFEYRNLPDDHNLQFAYYVVLDGRTIYKQMYTDAETFRVPVNTAGTYSVIYFVKSGDAVYHKTSDPLQAIVRQK